METLHYSRMNSPAGRLFLGASEHGLVVIAFNREDFPPRFSGCKNVEWKEDAQATDNYRRELEEYFGGERREFTFRLDLRGTPRSEERRVGKEC